MARATTLNRSEQLSYWLLALAAVLAILCFGFAPALLPPCPFHQFTGLDCPGCGSTRALRALLHGHPMKALNFNLLFLPALLMLLLGFSQRFGQPMQAIWQRLNRPKIVLVVVLSFWVLRNLPWPPFLWLRA